MFTNWKVQYYKSCQFFPIYRYNAIPHKIWILKKKFWVELDKPILKFIWKYNGQKIAKKLYKSQSERTCSNESQDLA